MGETKKFTKINEEFTCDICQKKIFPTLGDSYRNHCPFCLHSKHVDHNPGDRANQCQGILKPIGLENGKKGQVSLIFRCKRCKAEIKNKMVLKSKIQPDNYDLAVKISVQNR